MTQEEQLYTDLRQYLEDNLVAGTEKWLISVQIMTDTEAHANLRSDFYPCITIAPSGGSHPTGPFANTATQLVGVKLRIWASAYVLNASKLTPVIGSNTTKNIFDITEEVRRLLYANKQIAGALQMGDGFDYSDAEGVASGYMQIRDMYINYSFLEKYTGNANNQSTLDPQTI